MNQFFTNHFTLKFQCILISMLFFTSNIAFAQAGFLDQTFNNSGFNIFDNGNNEADAFEAVAIQPDGKIVLAGHYITDANVNGNFDVAIARLNNDGTLDNSFGNNGLVFTKVADIIPNQINKYVFDKALDVLIQPDGKILICGFSIVNVPGGKNDEDFIAVRYSQDGSLDSFFGYGGVAAINLAWQDIATGIALQSDGRIILVGESTSTEQNVPKRISVVRLNQNGTLDLTFGDNGKYFVEELNGTIPADVKIQPDDKIVIGGYTEVATSPASDLDFIVVRLDVDGSLDQTFNHQGFEIKSIKSGDGLNDFLNAIAIQPDGKIIAAGQYYKQGVTTDVVLLRFNEDGSMDNNFGTDGKAMGLIPDSLSSPGAEEVLIQPDGKIVVAGGLGYPSFMIARYNSDGSLDNSFGFGGVNYTKFSVNNYSKAYGLAIQKDGKLILSGYSMLSGENSNFAVARYNSGLNFEEVTFTNGGSFPLSYNQTHYGSIPAINWVIGQFSISSNSGNEILNEITVKLTGDFSGLEGKPFRLYSANENSYMWADSIGTNLYAVTPNQEITFTNLNEQLIAGTKYFYVTVDLTDNYWVNGNIHAVVENENKINLTGGNLSAQSQYGILDALIQLFDPSESVTLTPGETYFITWDKKSEVAEVNLDYSINAGKSWNSIAKQLHSAFTNYGWQVPEVNSDSCLIKISSSADSTIYDINDSLFSIQTTTGLTENSSLPKQFSLEQNYPNPFNPSTVISYQLSAVSQVELKVFDILGREVKTLVNEIQSAGNYKINFNASNLSSGIYLYKIKTEKFIQTKKMILVK